MGRAVAINCYFENGHMADLSPPPIVLVHGTMSDPTTWPSSVWHEGPTSLLKTRLCFANWSNTHTKGYSENYHHVTAKIEQALNEYRSGSDFLHNAYNSFHGIRYAATRADVVGHSQGGQLTRFYIAENTTPPGGIDRVGWSHTSWTVEARIP